MKKLFMKKSANKSNNTAQCSKKSRNKKAKTASKSTEQVRTSKTDAKECKTTRRNIASSAADNVSKKQTKTTKRRKSTIAKSKHSQKGNTAKANKSNHVLMPNSAEMIDTGNSIKSDYDNWWEEVSLYIDQSQSFEPDVWGNIFDTVRAADLGKEKLVSKCVKDRVPERYGMTQGEFFSEFMGLKDYEVSKLIKRNEVRTLISSMFMDIEDIKDSLLDKFASFMNKSVSTDLLIEELDSLHENNGYEFPTVAIFESRISGKLTELENLEDSQAEHQKYLESYNVSTPENDPIKDRLPNH